MKKGLLIALVALLCCGFIPQHKAVCQQSDSQPSLTEAYAEAIKSLAIHQDTLQTISQLGKIIERDSNYAPALNMLARVLRRPDYAAMFAERAYNLDTTNFYYLSNYGQALLRANEYEKAIPVYRKIIRQSSEANDYRILAILLDNAKQPIEVLSVLDSAVVRFGRIPEFSRMRQITYMNLGQTLMALSEAQKDVELAPYIAENHINLARTYATMGQDSLALVYFQSAVALDTLEVAPWVELGRFYRNKENKGAELSVMERLFANPNFSLGNKIAFWKDLIQNRDDYGKFYPQYDALIKRLYIYNGESREVAELYAEHLIASGEKEASLQIYKRFLNCKTPKLDDFEMVINFESYLNRHDSVDYYVRKALRHYPNNANLRITQGYLAFQRNEYDNSVLHFNEALEIADSDSLRSQVLLALGDVEHTRHNMKECYKAYEKALKLNPDNEGVLNNYAYFLSLENRDLERALKMVCRALELSANNPTYLDTKAWVLYKLGRYAEAKKVMQQALSFDRSQGYEYALHYGDILYALGEEFMAKVYWRKALERGADKDEITRRFEKCNK